MSQIISPEQFKDAEGPFKSKDAYSKWFKHEKENYLQTIKFKNLLQSSDFADYGDNKLGTTELLTKCGDSIYLPNEGLNNYSIFDFRQDLELFLQPFILLSLICYNVHLKWIDGEIYAVGIKKNLKADTKLAVSFSTRKIYRYTEENSLRFVASLSDKKKSTGSSYEYLFRELKLPISVVMNSVSQEGCPRHEHLTSKDKNPELYERYMKSIRNDEFNESQKVNKIYISKIFK